MGYPRIEGLGQEQAPFPLAPDFTGFVKDSEKLRTESEEARREDLRHMTEQIRMLAENTGLANAWDAVVNANIGPEYDRQVFSLSMFEPAESEGEQEKLSRDIAAAETGARGRLRDTFGLYRPGYERMIKPDLERLRQQPALSTMLYGSMSEHSANEFYDFSKAINPRAEVTVADLGTRWQQGAKPDIAKIQGDVIGQTVPPESQDLIATNLLLRYLRKDSVLPDGEKIVAMLEQARRNLKRGGVLLMNENSVALLARNFAGSMLTRLMLEETLRELGFSEVASDFALAYPDHAAKKRGDASRLVDHRQPITPAEMQAFRDAKNPARALADRFAFTVRAKK